MARARQRPFMVHDVEQAPDGVWVIPLTIYGGERATVLEITPKQAVRIASDLLVQWREYELAMKNPRSSYDGDDN